MQQLDQSGEGPALPPRNMQPPEALGGAGDTVVPILNATETEHGDTWPRQGAWGYVGCVLKAVPTGLLASWMEGCEVKK